MRILITLLLISVVSLTCCTSKKNMTVDTQTIKSVDTEDGYLTPIISVDFKHPKENPHFDIEKVIIDDHLLSIDVSHSGGCETHIFEMHTNKMYKKSMPPQLDVYLKYDNNNDLCEALISETLTFDISTLRYPGNADELTLIIHGANGDAKRISYKLK